MKWSFLFKLVIFDDIWIQCRFSMFVWWTAWVDLVQMDYVMWNVFDVHTLCHTMNDLYHLQSENKGSDFTGLEIRRILLYLKLQTRPNFSEIDGLIYQSRWVWHLHYLNRNVLDECIYYSYTETCQCSTMKTCSYNLQTCQVNSSPNLEDFTSCHILS